MHSIFNILRASLFGVYNTLVEQLSFQLTIIIIIIISKLFCGTAVVAAWSIIVLGIALHFQTAFVSSDARTYSCSTST